MTHRSAPGGLELPIPRQGRSTARLPGRDPVTAQRHGGRRARAAAFCLAAAAFLVATTVPYRIDTDTGFQLKSVEQWLRGESPTPATLRLPDPADLSRDLQVWSTWWPPGFPLIYAPLAATGLSLATALRATSFLLFLAGCLGWLRLADGLELSLPIRLLHAVSLAAYALTIGGAASLRSADILSFATAPWLVLLALRLEGSRAPAARFCLAGLALGSSVWLRYSLLLAALPLLGWAALRTLREPASRVLRTARLRALAAGFALPVVALFALDLRASQSFSESMTGTRSTWRTEDFRSARPALLALSLAGAPGLGLFQNDLWISHLAYFSDSRLPALRGLDHADRLVLKSLLGIPGTLLLFWALWRAHRRRPGSLPALALTVTTGFYLAVALASLLVRYNYLANETRFAAGVMPLTYPFVLAEILTGRGSWAGGLARRCLAAAAAVLFCAPLAMAAAIFLKDDLYARRASGYRPSATGLYTPELSREGPRGVQAAVAGAMQSPDDVMALAGPAGWGSAFAMWLELSPRTLPVSTFYAPLGGRFAAASNLRSASSYSTSRQLRVVLVAARSLVAEGWLPRLQARFPQARGWTMAPSPHGSEVVISFADLVADRR